jgi:hypothetical protein
MMLDIRQWTTVGRIGTESVVNQPNFPYLASADKPA